MPEPADDRGDDRGDDRAAASPAMASRQVLLALIVGQLGLHATMAGLRLATPLQALRLGAGAWTLGLLMALFAAAPVLLAMHTGRLADRLGYHRPVQVAVGLALLGMGFALASVWLPDVWALGCLCVAASLTGTAANMGMLTIQRTAGLAARNATERMRIFSWLGVAPSFSNVVGPVATGLMIDASGFGGAYALLLLMPLATLATARAVPVLPPPGQSAGHDRRAWDLLAVPGMKRLLAINWLFSMCWDVHTFAVPILGHDRGFSASTIGFVLGAFTLAVTGVRLLVPLLAHRIEEKRVLAAAMIGTALVFTVYPLAATPWLMGACAVLLGLTLGVAQPLIMTTLHQVTPEGRHGESLAFRSMAINASSTLMPLLFGALGTAIGAAALFWGVAGAVGAGSWLTRRLASVEGRLE
ncbi:MAG: MFS transporter [Proteobacteria bacterium]|nr:MFS transporter [Pseudomonadota bacterium]